MPIETVTLHADASFHPETKESGWGVWIRWSEGRIIQSGKGPSYVQDNNAAELAAVFAGLHLISQQSWFKELKTLYIRTDSLTVLRWIEDPIRNRRLPFATQLRPSPQEAVLHLREKIDEIRRLNPTCHWNLKHVRGHQVRSKSVAAYVNNVVDENARKARKARR